jgi:hypothetical protein
MVRDVSGVYPIGANLLPKIVVVLRPRSLPGGKLQSVTDHDDEDEDEED